jgi:hypothetical protein
VTVLPMGHDASSTFSASPQPVLPCTTFCQNHLCVSVNSCKELKSKARKSSTKHIYMFVFRQLTILEYAEPLSYTATQKLSNNFSLSLSLSLWAFFFCSKILTILECTMPSSLSLSLSLHTHHQEQRDIGGKSLLSYSLTMPARESRFQKLLLLALLAGSVSCNNIEETKMDICFISLNILLARQKKHIEEPRTHL